MSVEVGSKSKTIKYLNIHKEGRTSDDYVGVDERWSSPLLQKQDDYLVALSRFEVPLNRVAVTAQMDNCIQVYRYNDLYNAIHQVEADEIERAKQLSYIESALESLKKDEVPKRLEEMIAQEALIKN